MWIEEGTVVEYFGSLDALTVAVIFGGTFLVAVLLWWTGSRLAPVYRWMESLILGDLLIFVGSSTFIVIAIWELVSSGLYSWWWASGIFVLSAFASGRRLLIRLSERKG